VSQHTKAIRTGLAQKLAANSTLTNLLHSSAAIYHAQAPAQARFPLVIFNQQTNTRAVQAFGDKEGRSSLWLVKGVSVGQNSDRSDDISAAIEALLDEGTLTISGGSLYRMNWEQDVQYTEVEDGEQIRHSGSTFRLTYTTSS
jgi:hypothetical protein